jgi:Protein of unknown function (DUF1822)
VGIIEKPNQRYSIFVQILPINDERYLPGNLKLIILDSAANVQTEITATQSDKLIQIKFIVKKNEHFNVKVALDDKSVTEYFKI